MKWIKAKPSLLSAEWREGDVMLLFQKIRDVLVFVGTILLDGDVNPEVSTGVVLPNYLMVWAVADNKVEILFAFFEILDMLAWNHGKHPTPSILVV